MRSSSSTVAAERHATRSGSAPARAPGRVQTAITALLLLIWGALMAVGIVSLARPAWLERLGRHGVDAEARAYLMYGDSLLRQSNYPLAVAQYERGLQIKPNSAALLTNLGVAYLHLGDLGRAEEVLRRAAAQDARPRLHSTVFMNLALIAERQQKPLEAIEHCRRALPDALEPEKVYRKLGTLYASVGRYAEAREALQQALRLQLDVTHPYRKMLARTADDEKADPELVRELERRLAAGVSSDDLGHYDLDFLRVVLARDPEVAQTHALLGTVCAQLGDRDAALRHTEAALRIWPQNREAQQNRERLRLATASP
jgi:tetratricopeptide (TPR) repeat protein